MTKNDVCSVSLWFGESAKSWFENTPVELQKKHIVFARLLNRTRPSPKIFEGSGRGGAVLLIRTQILNNSTRSNDMEALQRASLKKKILSSPD